MFQIYIKRTLSNTKLATIMKKTVMEQAQEKSLGEKYGTTFCSRNTVRSQTSEGNLTFFKEELNGVGKKIVRNLFEKLRCISDMQMK